MPDRETVIVERGTNPMAVIAGVLFAVALVVVGYLVFFANGNAGTGGTVDIDVPAVSVDVVPDGQ